MRILKTANYKKIAEIKSYKTEIDLPVFQGVDPYRPVDVVVYYTMEISEPQRQYYPGSEGNAIISKILIDDTENNKGQGRFLIGEDILNKIGDSFHEDLVDEIIRYEEGEREYPIDTPMGLEDDNPVSGIDY